MYINYAIEEVRKQQLGTWRKHWKKRERRNPINSE